MAVSTIDKELREKIGKLKKSEQAKEVGKALAQRAQKPRASSRWSSTAADTATTGA